MYYIRLKVSKKEKKMKPFVRQVSLMHTSQPANPETDCRSFRRHGKFFSYLFLVLAKKPPFSLLELPISKPQVYLLSLNEFIR
jgi:hypothetical protein